MDNGIGSGTAKMVNNKSGGEESSIGNIDVRVDNKVIRVGVNRLRNVARSLLAGDEHYSRHRLRPSYLSACKSMSASPASSH